MQPKHVKEAFRLLNKSIIRVEQPDIALEEEEEEPAGEVEMETEESGYQSSSNARKPVFGISD